MKSRLHAVKMLLAQSVRRALAKKGIALSNLGGAVTENLESYLESLPARGVRIERVRVLDSDQDPSRILLNVYPVQQLHCVSRPNPPGVPAGEGDMLVEIDAVALQTDGFNVYEPYLRSATVVVARAQIGYFWSGQGDAVDLVAGMKAYGLYLRDVLKKPISGLSAPFDENVYFAFERGEEPANQPDDRQQKARLFEAVGRLSRTILPGREYRRLGGRGSYGLQGGLCNPGAIPYGDGWLLLPRGEREHWPVQKKSWSSFVNSCQPMLLSVSSDLRVVDAAEINLETADAPGTFRTEDFRLFGHRDQIYANHSLMQAGDSPPQTVIPAQLQTGISISRLDPPAGKLVRLGAPRLDRPMGRMEKNWAFFASDEVVHLIYSFNPYRLFAAPRFPDLDFKARIERSLRLHLPEDGVPLRNSINPVPYDADHLLHVVHRPSPSKPYVFWAVLINRGTLVPTHMSRRPILRGGAQATATIIYLSSAAVRPDEVLLFGGIDDSSIGVWRVARAALDREWQPIT